MFNSSSRLSDTLISPSKKKFSHIKKSDDFKVPRLNLPESALANYDSVNFSSSDIKVKDPIMEVENGTTENPLQKSLFVENSSRKII